MFRPRCTADCVLWRRRRTEIFAFTLLLLLCMYIVCTDYVVQCVLRWTIFGWLSLNNECVRKKFAICHGWVWAVQLNAFRTKSVNEGNS